MALIDLLGKIHQTTYDALSLVLDAMGAALDGDSRQKVTACLGYGYRYSLPVQASGDVTATWATQGFFPYPDGVVVRYASGTGLQLAGDLSDRTVLDDEGFDDDSEWTAGTGWAVTGSAAVATSASDSISQASKLTIGERYVVVFKITNSAGTVTPYCGATAGTARGGTPVTDKVYAEIIACATAETFALTGSGFSGSIPWAIAVPIGPEIPNGVCQQPYSYRRLVAAVSGTSVLALSSAGEGVWPMWLRDKI